MSDKMATRQAYGEALVALGKEDENIVVLDADLSKSTMTVGFSKEYSDRFFNMGIAEQNLMGTAAGLAASGKTVFASTFAMFAAGRAFEIVRNAICYPSLNVKVCATHAGITVGEDGASHQAIEDIALMRAIPNIIVINPSDPVSAKKAIFEVAKYKGPAYVRLGRVKVESIYEENLNFEIGKGICLKEGAQATVIATGVMVHEALKAAELLESKGIRIRVIDMHTIKPIDEKIIIKAAAETGAIITAEEHNVIGGLGSAVAEVVVKHHPVKMKMIGIQDIFGESGKPDELMKKFNITSEDIVKAVNEIIK